MSVKAKILESLKAGPKTVEELVAATGAKPGIVKGQLTRLVKAGVIEKTPEGKFKMK
ncbi:MAG: winged helix-turn-helix domain-containing protein [archaeon GBS-70-058]|nr:winged helix-turn-helix domain-containing protein [Candidatus Culexarchaeum nevadense]